MGSYSTDRCSRLNGCIAIAKMTSPTIVSRMEKRDDFLGNRIPSGNIRTFMAIAAATAKTKIVCVCFAAVLLCEDVIDLEGKVVEFLGKKAVFAPPLSAIANQTFERSIHSRS